MVTATDEANQTNATQSATNNTVRVADDSYCPLAFSDDIPSGAGSHIGAGGHPVTRDSISSAPQQDETADENYLNSSTLPRSSEDMKRGNALERFISAYNRGALDSWFYECAALAFSVGCLVALGVMLTIYDGKETPQLPYNITLNALISVLSTAAKSSLLFAVAGTLGQVKWAWFTENRQLSDMQTFDDATRGPWGALFLLFSRSIRPLASLGAAITILALAYGPFLQQLVRYSVVQERVATAQATTKRATTLDATRNFSNWDAAKASIWSDLSQFDFDPDCPTGNCTWPPFKSLGYCSKCGDTTADTSLNCSANVASGNWNSSENCEICPEQGYPATVWQRRIGIEPYTLRSIVWSVRETSGFGRNMGLLDPVLTPTPEPDSAFQSGGYSYVGVGDPWLVFAYALFDEEVSYNDVPVLVQVDTCVITPCERTYQLSMSAGQLDTIILDTDYGTSAVLVWPHDFREPERCWRTRSYRGSDAPLPPTPECSNWSGSKWYGMVGTACHGGDPTAGYIFCSPVSAYWSANLSDSIGLLGRERGVNSRYLEDAYMPVYNKSHRMTTGFPMDIDTSRAIQAHNFSYLMEKVAASLTKAEIDNSSTVVFGDMFVSVVHVEVVWYWFILPATLNVVAILLLLATAILSHRRKTQLWKSSALALLYHGLDDPEPAQDLGLASVSEMERWASRTSAKLGSVKDGGRAVLRTLPRDRASRD